METDARARFLAQLAAGRARLERATVALAARAQRVVAGDIFSFERLGVSPLEARCVVLERDHGTPQLWRSVWTDLHPLAGPYDRRVGDATVFGPFTIRCSLPLWVHEDDLPLGDRVAFLDAWDLARAREALEAWTAGEPELTPSQEAALCDPDYLEWRGKLEALRSQVRHTLHAEPEVHVVERMLARLRAAFGPLLRPDESVPAETGRLPNLADLVGWLGAGALGLAAGAGEGIRVPAAVAGAMRAVHRTGGDEAARWTTDVVLDDVGVRLSFDVGADALSVVALATSGDEPVQGVGLELRVGPARGGTTLRETTDTTGRAMLTVPLDTEASLQVGLRRGKHRWTTRF